MQSLRRIPIKAHAPPLAAHIQRLFALSAFVFVFSLPFSLVFAPLFGGDKRGGVESDERGRQISVWAHDAWHGNTRQPMSESRERATYHGTAGRVLASLPFDHSAASFPAEMNYNNRNVFGTGASSQFGLYTAALCSIIRSKQPHRVSMILAK